MGVPNWGRLFIEGRCKAIGIPFSDEENEAIKNGVNPKEIQTGKWKGDEEEIKKCIIHGEEYFKQYPDNVFNNCEKCLEEDKSLDILKKKETEPKKETADDKEVKKQLRQTLRDRGIGFTNFDTIEKLQEKLQANI